jgi:septal ring factor EnvC (AmiA/AmiB activator)
MRIRRAPLYAAVALCAAACANPRHEANVAQALSDAATEISALRNDIAQLQTDVDSLRAHTAQRDTLINRILTVTNIPR